MIDCKSVATPISTVPLGIDAEGDPFDEEWEYTTILGMLMYLAQISRPNISYVVDQCTQFTHDSRKSHVVGIKRILRYL